MIAQQLPPEADATPGLVEETYQALLALGHSPPDAHKLLEEALATKKKFKTFDELIQEIYQRQRG